MIPTWVAVVTGISLAILALAAIVMAAASVVAALGLRMFLRMLHELAGPAVGDVRGLVATIRTEAEGWRGRRASCGSGSSAPRMLRRHGSPSWTPCSRWCRKRWRQ